jgi:hypothetical protein
VQHQGADRRPLAEPVSPYDGAVQEFGVRFAPDSKYEYNV